MNYISGIDWGDVYLRFQQIMSGVAVVGIYLFLVYATILYIFANKIRFGFGVVPKKTERIYNLIKETTLDALGSEERWRSVADETDEKHETFSVYYLDRQNIEGQVVGRIYRKENSIGVYVYVHGTGDDLTRGLEYLEFARKHNLDLVVYDQPNHGKSSNNGRGNDFGYHNFRAMNAVLDFISDKFGNRKIVLHGSSMGGATIIYSLSESETKEKVWYKSIYKVILENPVLDLRRLFFSLTLDLRTRYLVTNHILKMYGFLTKTNPFYTPISLLSKLHDFEVFLFHSKEDDLIPFYLSLQAARQNTKIKLHLYDKGEHSMLYNTDKRPFEEVLGSF